MDTRKLLEELENVIKHLIQPKITWSVENIVEKLG